MLSTLILRNVDRNGLSSIYCQYVYKGNSKRWSTGIKIPATYWNGDKQKIKAGALDNVDQANASIYELKGRIDAIIQSHYSEFAQAPTIQHIESVMNKAIEAKQANELTLLDCMEKYLQNKEPYITEQSMKTYKSLRTNLREFESKYKQTLTFADIDNLFFERFTKLLLSKGSYTAIRNGKTVKVEREPYLNTTVRRRIKSLRDFLNYWVKAGINTNLTFKGFSIKAIKNVGTDVVTLDTTEFEAFRTLDLSENKRLEYVRDLFVLQCVTGLRYSDVICLNKTNIGNNFIHIVTQKTKDNLSIPLNPISKSILEKYKFEIRRISNQKYNEYLKEVAKLVTELHKLESVISFSGSKRMEKRIPKYELIGSHVGRKSFVTLLLERGVNPANIMKWTGHKSIQIFLNYINKRQGETEQMNKAFN